MTFCLFSGLLKKDLLWLAVFRFRPSGDDRLLRFESFSLDFLLDKADFTDADKELREEDDLLEDDDEVDERDEEEEDGELSGTRARWRWDVSSARDCTGGNFGGCEGSAALDVP